MANVAPTTVTTRSISMAIAFSVNLAAGTVAPTYGTLFNTNISFAVATIVVTTSIKLVVTATAVATTIIFMQTTTVGATAITLAEN
jgi:hypothetical protein